MRRVVITGMGIYSCIGTNREEVTASLRAGKSGIIYDEKRKDFGYRSALTGMVPPLNLKKELTRRQRISIGAETEYAYVASQQAFEQAGIDRSKDS